MTIAVDDARPQSDTPRVSDRLARTTAGRVLAVLEQLQVAAGGSVEVTVGELMARVGATERTIQRATKALRAEGAISVEESRGGASRFTIPAQ